MPIGQTPMKRWPFFIFKMAAVRHLSFLEVRNFNSRYVSSLNLRHYVKFCESCQTVAEIWPFLIFQDGGRPPSWIYYTPVWTIHEEHLVVFVTVKNLVEIGAVLFVLRKF